MSVRGERAFVDERRVSLELLQHFTGLEAMQTDRMVERGGQHLAVVARELQTRNALHVGLLKATQTLAGRNAPHLDLAILRSGRHHFRVTREGQRQHGRFHHHEIVLEPTNRYIFISQLLDHSIYLRLIL